MTGSTDTRPIVELEALSCRDAQQPTGFLAVVISLARNTERRAVMQQRLEAAGAAYQCVDAIDGQKQLVPRQVHPRL